MAKQEEKTCPLMSVANALVNKDFQACDPNCAWAVPYFQTTEGINHCGFVCALTAPHLLDSEGRLKV